jgi:hypothetical protein
MSMKNSSDTIGNRTRDLPALKHWDSASNLTSTALLHVIYNTLFTKKKIINVLGKNGCTEYRKGNKTVPGKVATTLQRMGTNRIPKQALKYKPKGRRNIGRPRKKWRDQLRLEDQGTGNSPNPS